MRWVYCGATSRRTGRGGPRCRRAEIRLGEVSVNPSSLPARSPGSSARKSARTEALEKVAKAGVEILADEFSLRERGIDAARLPASVKKAALDVVIDHLEDGRKVVWY